MLQGLLTPEGHIQCVYHGWKFDGGSGECVDIPQLKPGTLRTASAMLFSQHLHSQIPCQTLHAATCHRTHSHRITSHQAHLTL